MKLFFSCLKGRVTLISYVGLNYQERSQNETAKQKITTY